MAYSLLDVIQGNPFDAAANQAVGQSGNYPPAPIAGQDQSQVFPPAPTPAAQQPGGLGDASQNPMLQQANQIIQNYSPMRDPEGALGRSGWIGALLANGPSRQDYILARQQQYQQMAQQQLGSLRYNAYTQLSQNVQQGMTPQKAFLNFLSTPAGADFMHKDPNPGEALQQFMQLGTVDPMRQARMDAFGGPQANQPGNSTVPGGAGPMAPGGTAPVSPVQAGGALPAPTAQGTPAATVGTPSGNPSSQQASPQEVAQSSILDPQYYLSKANQLMAAGDVDGAKVAATLATQAQQARAYLHPSLDTPEVKNYTAYAAQSIAAGKQPVSFDEYTLRHQRAGAITGETAEAGDLGHMRAAVIKSYADLGRPARDTLQTLGQMNDALNQGQGNISTGPGADLFLQAKQAFGNIIGENLEGTQNAEVFKKMGAYLASSASKELTSRPTQFDFKTFIANNPGLEVSVPGNKMLIDLMAQKAQHDMDVSNLAVSYKGQAVDWPDALAAYDKAHPFISPFTGKPIKPDEVVSGIQNEMVKPAQGASGQQQQSQYTEGQTATGPGGAKMIYQNGGWKPLGK